MEEKKETNRRNETKVPRPHSQNSKPLHIRKTILRKVIPYILVGCITSSAVMMAHNEAREVKAVAVVDDIILLTALLAMAGIAYVGVSDYWTNSQWEEDTEENEELAERIAHQWNWNAKQKGVLLGYIDPETGEYIGALEGTGGNTGSGSDDDNDDNNKFPTWQKLKELVAKNGGNLKQALGTGAGFLIGAYATAMLESSEKGAKMAGGLPTDVYPILHDMDNAYGKFLEDKKMLISDYPYYFTIIQVKGGKCTVDTLYSNDTCRIFALKLYGDDGKISEYRYGSHNAYRDPILAEYRNGDITVKKVSYYALVSCLPNLYIRCYGNIPFTNSQEESLAFYDNPYPIYADTYINPSTIGKSTALAKKLAETGGILTESLYKNVTLPTTEQLNQYFEDLNNAEDEEEKQQIMDEFVDSLVTPAENPNPDPDNPDNPDKPANPDTPDNPTNNDTFLADLKHLFPFCIPFDLVDCFKLFNAEPVTPRVEFPVHFGIINYDHTFVIDLKDFNNVAVVCRSTFLIIYMTGLILATRALIKG